MAVLAVLLLGGCATAISGTPSAAPAATQLGLPLTSEQEPAVELFSTMRTWDMCGLHDVAAAGTATGYRATELVPYLGIDQCKLTLTEPDGVTDWEMSLALRRISPDAGPGISIGAVTLPQADMTDSSCAYSYPVGEADGFAWGIEITAYNIDPPRPNCDVARDYATALAPKLADPPKHSAGTTVPALTLPATDPCALVAAMLPIATGGTALPDEGVRVDLDGPYACNLTAQLPGDASERVRLTVEYDAESEPLAGGTVAGRPATPGQSAGDACSTTFQASDTSIQGDPGLPATVEAVELGAPCAGFDQLAEAAAGAIATARVPAKSPDALTIGDLNPPPSAASTGAPFDPCTVGGGWAAYPAEVRPEGREPVPMTVAPDDPFAVGCKYNSGDMFSSLVWGQPTGAFSADPASRPGSTAVTYAGKPGTENRSALDDGSPNCFSAVQLANGIAAMSTGLPGDPCAVNRAVLDKVAAAVP